MPMRLTVVAEPLPELFVLERRPIGDARGYLERVFCADELRPLGWSRPVAQINRTLTREAGTLRGLHFQRPPHGETKFVSCLEGRVFDLALDVRDASPSFGRWHGEELSADNGRSLLIPPGFAHGFLTLEADCAMLYMHDAPHVAEAEQGFDALDPELAIDWPIAVRHRSDRDAGLPPLSAGIVRA